MEKVYHRLPAAGNRRPGKHPSHHQRMTTKLAATRKRKQRDAKPARATTQPTPARRPRRPPEAGHDRSQSSGPK